ncbi:MAG: hypothetical protein R6X16_15515 [Anaerolineae bacterium]
MPGRCRVVLYGDSLVLAGVGQSLECYPRFKVLSVDASGDDAPGRLEALCPAAVILDLSVVSMDLAFSLLEGHPDLLLIGLDPGGDKLVMLSGYQARSMSTADLARLIETGVAG